MKILNQAIVGLGLVLLNGVCAADQRNALKAAHEVQVDITSQPLRLALTQFAQQTGVQLLFSEDEVPVGKEAPRVAGSYTPETALRMLLSNTDLRYEFVNERTVAIRAMMTTSGIEEEAPRNVLNMQRVSQADTSSSAREETGREDKKSSSRAAVEGDKRAGGDHAAGVQEIIVTATKRAENIQRVPLSITAITAEDITRRGLVSAEDYLRGVPGVNQGSSLSGSSVIIRGLETAPSFQNFSSGATVGTYFGETATTDSGGLSNNGSVDIKLVDIERVEILRGPQGTAFGNSSLGGVVRTIPVAPKLDRFEGRVGASYSMTARNGDDNTMIQAVGNIPLLKDKLAIRATVYQFEDSGFYRNLAGSDAAFRSAASQYGAEALPFAVDENDVGAVKFTGARASALLQANDNLQFTLSYLTQKTESDGLPLTNTGTGYDQLALQVPPEHVVRGQTQGVSDTEIDLANLTMEYDFGWANLLGTYSYIESGSDLTRPQSIFGATFLVGVPLSQRALSGHRAHSGEIRLATQLDGAWNFLGGLYTEELDDATVWPYVWHGDPLSQLIGGGRYPGNQQDYSDQRNLRHRAAFTEASWEFVPRWTITGGVRAYQFKRTVHVETQGRVYGNQITTDVVDRSGNNFRANLSYKPSDDILLYAGWTEGFRLGKPQPGLSPSQCDRDNDGLVDGSSITIAATKSIDSDAVKNTEIGGKFTLLDRRLMITAALFRIDWTGMPFVVATACGPGYLANAGTARSDGIESQVNFHINEAWRVDVGGSYTRARLTQDVPAQRLSAGDRLPGSPKLNANLGLQYGFAIGRHEAFLRSDSIYIGTFSNTLPYSVRAEAGGYMKLDVSAGVRFDNLSVNLYARNLTGADELAFTETASFGYRLRPRTIGFQLGYDF